MPAVRIHALRFVSIAGVLIGCSCGTSAITPDAGTIDARVDTGPPLEAWLPAFEPRIVWEDTSVSCTPITYQYAATRELAEPGAVRWVYHPASDPAFRGAARSHLITSFGFTLHRVTITSAGGLVAVIDDFLDLGLDSEGGFEWLDRRLTERDRPDHAWLPPSSTLGYSLGLGLSVARHPWMSGSTRSIPPGEFPVGLPGIERVDARLRGSRPALLADGSVVWTPTPSSIVIACVEDGRIRAIIEHDPAPAILSGLPALFAPRSGGFVFVWGEAYRFDDGGRLVAHASPRDPRGIQPLGISDRCGLAMARHDRLEWWDFETMTPRMSVMTDALDWGLYARPMPDCGLVEWHANAGRRIRRLSDAGAWIYNVVDPATEGVVRDIWPLDDGGVLLFYDGPLQLVNVGPDGDVRQHIVLDTSVVGESVFVPNFALTPDGVLYFVSDTGLGASQSIVAIETGVRPVYPLFGLSGQSGLDWALTNATWTTAE